MLDRPDGRERRLQRPLDDRPRLAVAGLIRREVRGRIHICRLEPEPLASAHEWLSFYERFWRSRLDVLEKLLRQDKRRPPRPPKKGK